MMCMFPFLESVKGLQMLQRQFSAWVDIYISGVVRPGPAGSVVNPIWSKFGQNNGETECGCLGTAFGMSTDGGADPHTQASKTCMQEFHADLASCHLGLAGRACLTRLWGCEQAWAG